MVAIAMWPSRLFSGVWVRLRLLEAVYYDEDYSLSLTWRPRADSLSENPLSSTLLLIDLKAILVLAEVSSKVYLKKG